MSRGSRGIWSIFLTTLLLFAITRQVWCDEIVFADLVVNGISFGAIVSRKTDDGAFWLPVRPVGDALEIVFDKQGMVDTPAGTVRINASLFRTFDGTVHINVSLLSKKLPIRFAFDRQNVVFSFRTPWHRHDGGTDLSDLSPDSDATEIRADILSFAVLEPIWRSRLSSLRARAGGALFGGLWMGDLNWRQAPTATGAVPFSIDRLFWQKSFGTWGLRIGSQPTQNDVPVSFWGVSAVWDTAGVNVLSRGFDPLFSEPPFPGETPVSRRIEGQGPPGGRVRVYVDGVFSQEKPIGLDGRYTVTVRGLAPSVRKRIRMEVIPPFSHAPARIEEITVDAPPFMLDRGRWRVLGGFGMQRAPARFGFGPPTGHVSFAYGASDHVTVGGMLFTRHHPSGTLSLGVELFGKGAWFASGGLVDGRPSWRTSLRFGGDRWTARFYDWRSQSSIVHGFDVSWSVSNRFSVGVSAGSSRKEGGGGFWAFPKIFWAISDRWRLTSSAGANTYPNMTLTGSLTKRFRLDFGLAPTRRRLFAGATWRGESFSAGVSVEWSQAGYAWRAGVDWRLNDALSIRTRYATDSHELYPNVLLSWKVFPGVDFEAAWMPSASDRGDVLAGLRGRLRIQLAKTVDGYGVSEIRDIHPASGTLAVEIVDDSGKRVDVERVWIYVDGKQATQTFLAGRIFVYDVPAGRHRIGFDEEGLPIDVHPVKRKYVVDIAPMAVTRLKIATVRRYAITGRILIEHAKDVPPSLRRVRIEGEGIRKTVMANRFGVFHVQNLPRGRYTIFAAGTKKTVVIRDASLIGLVLRIPAYVAPVPSGSPAKKIPNT